MEARLNRNRPARSSEPSEPQRDGVTLRRINFRPLNYRDGVCSPAPGTERSKPRPTRAPTALCDRGGILYVGATRPSYQTHC